MSIVKLEGTYYNLCERHQVLYLPSQICGQCAAGTRDTLDLLEARISDLETRMLRIGAQLGELQQNDAGARRAHNAMAQAAERLLTRIEQILAHVQPREELLP